MAAARINSAHEYGRSGNALVGGYVGLLSRFGMFMFDEFLNQFERGAESVRWENAPRRPTVPSRSTGFPRHGAMVLAEAIGWYVAPSGRAVTRHGTDLEGYY